MTSSETGRQIVVDVEAHAVRTRDRPESPHRVLHEVGDVDAFGLDVERAGADPAQLERVAHESLQALGLVRDGLEELASFFGLDPRPRRQQRSRGRLHRGQRCAQVVTHRGEESGALAPDLGGESRLAHLVLQSQAVDTGREPGDERLEQFAIGGREILGRPGQQCDARTVDPHVGARQVVRRPTVRRR